MRNLQVNSWQVALPDKWFIDVQAPTLAAHGLQTDRLLKRHSANHCDDSSNSFIQLRFLRTSRGLVPSGGPTMPSFSIRSINRAARP